MTEITADAPRVIVFPPLLPLASLGLAILLQWLYPLGFLSNVSLPVRLAIGLPLLAAGAGLVIAGQSALQRNGTNVLPSRPALALVETGAFSWTRNPMYVGGSVALLACALCLALDWLPLLSVASFVVLHFGVVRREEAYLERAFANRYRQYRARVPRYLGF